MSPLERLDAWLDRVGRSPALTVLVWVLALAWCGLMLAGLWPYLLR